MAGLLPANYWDTPTPAATPEPVAPAPQPTPAPEQASLDLFGNADEGTTTPTTSPDSTTATAPASNGPGLGYLIPNALGFGLPDPDTFQSMTSEQKAGAYAMGAVNATKKLVTGLVSAIPVGLGDIAATGIEGVRGVVAGAKRGFTVSPERALADEQQQNLGGTKADYHTTIPLGPFGTAQSWYKTYDDAIGSGAGPLAASLLTGGTAIGDASIATGIAESIGNLARPKPSTTGLEVANTEPITTAITNDSGKVKFSQKADSVNEYYDSTKSLAKKYGGNPGNIKVKLSPVGDGTMEASIVRIGSKGDVPSDFNGLNETKLFSQTLPMAPEAQAALNPEGVPLPPRNVFRGGEIISKDKITPMGISVSPNEETASAYAGSDVLRGGDKGNIPEGKGSVTKFQIDPSANILNAKNAPKDLIDYYLSQDRATGREKIVDFANKNGYDGVDFTKFGDPEIRIFNSDMLKSTEEAATSEATPQDQIQIPQSAPKGQENAPITADQMGQLDLVSKVNGISDTAKTGIINALTGKTAVGELTQAEYVNVAQQLAKLDGAAKYSPALGMNNIASDWLGRRDSYFNSVQERTGIQTGDMYNRVENARRFTTIATQNNEAALRDIYGKYWDPESGSMVRQYKQGNVGAILDNPDLNDAQKADLVNVAKGSIELSKKMGVQYNVPEDKFLENYSSNIRDTGGSVTQYSKPDEFPTGSNFYAKYKRTGGLAPYIEDDRAIMQIYNHSGAKSTYMPDALKFAKDVYDSAPDEYKPAIKAYADVISGRADATERFLNNTSDALNKKLGLNLPPDATRKAVQLMMDTTYAASMGVSPSTVLRHLITQPTFIYAEEGSSFIGKAMMDYFKDPASAVQELRGRGFKVQTADPYGSAIANEDTTFGNVANQYRRLTSASMAPLNVSDSFGRYIAMKVSDYKFNNAIDLYNEGKMSWPQVESALDFDGMSQVDRNEIRQQLAQGNRDAAMNQRARVKIDDTQFPYRTGTLGSKMNGALGKPTFQFSAYADNYINMLHNWVSRGQWDKVVRFVGAQGVVYKTMLNQFGINEGSNMGLNAAVPSLSPLVKTSSDFYNLMSAIKSNSQADIDTNKQNLVQEAQSLGFPGVEPARVMAFLKSYNAGPNAQGLYQVQSASGKLNYAVPFSDLWWGMFGFPTADKTNVENVANDEVNASAQYTDAKNQILQKIGSGDVNGAKALMQSTGVTPTPGELNSYLQAMNIPLTLRLYEQLPKALQPQFSQRVLQTLHPGQ